MSDVVEPKIRVGNRASMQFLAYALALYASKPANGLRPDCIILDDPPSPMPPLERFSMCPSTRVPIGECTFCKRSIYNETDRMPNPESCTRDGCRTAWREARDSSRKNAGQREKGDGDV